MMLHRTLLLAGVAATLLLTGCVDGWRDWTSEAGSRNQPPDFGNATVNNQLAQTCQGTDYEGKYTGKCPGRTLDGKYANTANSEYLRSAVERPSVIRSFTEQSASGASGTGGG